MVNFGIFIALLFHDLVSCTHVVVLALLGKVLTKS